MAFKIEIKSNTFYITDTSTGLDWKLPAKYVAYDDNNENIITFYDVNSILDNFSITFPDIVDSNNNAFVSFQDVIKFCDDELGKSNAGTSASPTEITDLNQITKAGLYYHKIWDLLYFKNEAGVLKVVNTNKTVEVTTSRNYQPSDNGAKLLIMANVTLNIDPSILQDDFECNIDVVGNYTLTNTATAGVVVTPLQTSILEADKMQYVYRLPNGDFRIKGENK